MPTTLVEFDERNRADIDDLGRGVFFMNRGIRSGWKVVTSLSAREMDDLCASWSEYKQKPPVGARGTSTGGDPAIVE